MQSFIIHSTQFVRSFTERDMSGSELSLGAMKTKIITFKEVTSVGDTDIGTATVQRGMCPPLGSWRRNCLSQPLWSLGNSISAEYGKMDLAFRGHKVEKQRGRKNARLHGSLLRERPNGRKEHTEHTFVGVHEMLNLHLFLKEFTQKQPKGKDITSRFTNRFPDRSFYLMLISP